MRARTGGAAPISQAAYAALPKVRKHRAWLPTAVDLTARFPAPGDQEWQGSCTAWATGYAARSFLHSADLGRAPHGADEIISPQYIYNKIRPGDPKQCNAPGALPDALNLLTIEGSATLSDFPYNSQTCQQAPPETLKASAAHFRIKGWRAIDHETPDDWRTPLNLDDLKGQLAQGLPVVFAMRVPSDFYNKKDATIYKHALSPADPGSLHAMALVGYDDNRQAVRLINSWGVGWGDKGYAWVDYGTFKQMTTEAYAIEPLNADQSSPVSPTAISAATLSDTGPSPEARLTQLLAGAACGKMNVSMVGGRRTVQGFVGSEADIAFLKAKALAIDPALDWRVELRRWPQCEADLTLEKTVQDSPVRLTIANASGAAQAGDQVNLRQGQLFSINVETTAKAPFVHVIYIQADGSAVELYRDAPPTGADGRHHALIGAGGAGQVRFQVSAPYGDEMVIALAGTGPLFDTRLGRHVTERQFLTMLRTRLAQARLDGTDITGAVTRIHTSEQ